MINTDLLVEIAAMHYESGLNQEEIANRIGVSRPYISRLLKRAHTEGIVEIIVHRPVTTDSYLQHELTRHFGLLDARVLATPADPSHTGILIGQLGASYLNAIIREAVTIAVSFGESVFQVVNALPRRNDLKGIRVTQLVGGQHGLSTEKDSPMVAELLARRLDAPFYRLHAPLMLDSPEARDSLVASPTIADVLKVTQSADIALVGIGAWTNFAPSLRRLNYHLDDQELKDLENAGVVGDVLTRCIDRSGAVIPSSINRRIIGLDPNALKDMRWSIGIAWQIEKIPAILASLRGQFLNVLLTDDACAQQLLAHSPDLQ
jgi:DNA-binding transcriptional regulator LsrR (DeoR family)